MDKKIVRLINEQCMEITLVAAGKPYSGKLKGDTYSQYRFEGTMFTVNDNLGFKAAVENGDLALVKLLDGTREKTVVDDQGNEVISTVRSLELDSFFTETASFAKELRRAKHDAAIITIKRVAEAASLTEEGKAALLDASI